MAYPTYEEWFASLSSEKRQKTTDLVAQFRAAGCDDPEGWARSEVSENFAQFARFLVLQSLWWGQIDSWQRDQDRWISRTIDDAKRDPKGFFSDAGIALAHMKERGVLASDIAALARMVAYSTVFGTLNRIDEGQPLRIPPGSPGWCLMEVDADGRPTDRQVGGLHESILSMDPSGREGRPA